MNKRRWMILLCILLLAVFAILIIVNRQNAAANDALAVAHRLEIGTSDGSRIYAFDESSADFTEFDTQMRRKNGDVSDKHYGGIEFCRILAELDIAVDDSLECVFICADQYEITVSGSEILEPGNVYLVTREGDLPLEEDQGPFMLVINHDEFSTRWGRQIVKVKIGE